MADFYELLGVSRDADADTLKRAYRQQARKYHPDVNKEAGAEDKFKEIGKASVSYTHLTLPTILRV